MNKYNNPDFHYDSKNQKLSCPNVPITIELLDLVDKKES